MNQSQFFDHDAFARSVGAADFRRQVKRTIDGEPLSDEDVGELADFVSSTLAASGGEHLLDIGCGNGELLSLYSRNFAAVVGIDPSEHLIRVARRNFASDRISFVRTNTLEYLEGVVEPERFTHVCFFASFQYLSPDEAEQALSIIGRRFPSVIRILLGNLPDLHRREAFAAGVMRHPDPLTEHLTAVGRWLTAKDVLARLPGRFFVGGVREPECAIAGSHYRFHLVLERLPPA